MDGAEGATYDTLGVVREQIAEVRRELAELAAAVAAPRADGYDHLAVADEQLREVRAQVRELRDRLGGAAEPSAG